MNDLFQRVAFVLGAAQDVGFEIAKSLSMAGSFVIIADSDAQQAARAKLRLKAAGCDVCTVALRGLEEEFLEDAADAATSIYGGIHYLFNCVLGAGNDLNAGVSCQLPPASEVVANGLRVFVPRMKRHGDGGHIFIAAYVERLLVGPQGADSTATPLAVVSRMFSMRNELARAGIGLSLLGLDRNCGSITQCGCQCDCWFDQSIGGGKDGAETQIPDVSQTGIDHNKVGEDILRAVADRLPIIAPLVKSRVHLKKLLGQLVNTIPAEHDTSSWMAVLAPNIDEWLATSSLN
jgi:NADP-dependent 3-hydroxy acid dehydrogenase YdfG